jgi:hypothetical protein
VRLQSPPTHDCVQPEPTRPGGQQGIDRGPKRSDPELNLVSPIVFLLRRRIELGFRALLRWSGLWLNRRRLGGSIRSRLLEGWLQYNGNDECGGVRQFVTGSRLQRAIRATPTIVDFELDAPRRVGLWLLHCGLNEELLTLSHRNGSIQDALDADFQLILVRAAGPPRPRQLEASRRCVGTWANTNHDCRQTDDDLGAPHERRTLHE